LHVATHGFFSPPEVPSAVSTESGEYAIDDFLDDQRSVAGWHVGLLSGLALAGANRHQTLTVEQLDGSTPLPDDGIFTSLELAGLNLNQTDLVVLSACETGLGRVAGGEGVLGLQRAFQVSGARSVVTSLWKVDDQSTRDLMTAFYENIWVKRMPKLEALRQAQLAILNRSSHGATRPRGPGGVTAATTNLAFARAHPRFWAAWVLSGDPGMLVMETVPPTLATAADLSTSGTTSAGNSSPAAPLATSSPWVAAAAIVLLLAGIAMLGSATWRSRRRGA
jgi:CHAT domain-containing protein